jgi:hypothetical protein
MIHNRSQTPRDIRNVDPHPGEFTEASVRAAGSIMARRQQLRDGGVVD